MLASLIFIALGSGSISGRFEMVKTKHSAVAVAAAIADAKLEAQRSQWRSCTLSQQPLTPPVVCDDLGHLFNKERLLEAMLSKALPSRLSHIRGLRDVFPVLLQLVESADTDSSHSSAVGSISAATDDALIAPRFTCPVTMLPANGRHRFVATRACGCVLSERAVREVPSAVCLVCGAALRATEAASSAATTTTASAIDLSPEANVYIVLFPNQDEEDRMRSAMEARRASEPKKEKKVKKSTDTDESGAEVGSKRSAVAVDSAPTLVHNKFVRTAANAPTSSITFSSDVQRVQKEALEAVEKKLKSSSVAAAMFRSNPNKAEEIHSQLRR
jgi:hypothetical protein